MNAYDVTFNDSGTEVVEAEYFDIKDGNLVFYNQDKEDQITNFTVYNLADVCGCVERISFTEKEKLKMFKGEQNN